MRKALILIALFAAAMASSPTTEELVECVDNLKERIQALEAENADLRDQVTSLENTVS